VIYLRRLTESENEDHTHIRVMENMHRLAMSWMSTYDYVVRLKLNLPWLLKRDKDKGTIEEITSFANKIERWFNYWDDEYVDMTYNDVPKARYIADFIEEGLQDEATR